jgi:hypothetical protein
MAEPDAERPVPGPPLDPSFFADNPARDPRFRVTDRWVDCVNFPAGHPLRFLEFLHRQMNEEVNSLESSSKSLSDFPLADWELRMWLARQCADEARHAAMFRRLFERRGGEVGEYPVLNFQYRIITRNETLIGRLAIQNRSFEAGGIDAIAFGIDDSADRGDEEMAELYEAQLADEIVHVRFANEWIQAEILRNSRNVLAIGKALTAASRAFRQVMGAEATEGATYPVATKARLESGFTGDEIKLAADLAAATRAATP